MAKKRKFYNPELQAMLSRAKARKDKSKPESRPEDLQFAINPEAVAENEARVRQELTMERMRGLLATLTAAGGLDARIPQFVEVDSVGLNGNVVI